jgi:NAD(P)-dependent dehydrogenase (short-subunit alcohol dehydrogenase family)
VLSPGFDAARAGDVSDTRTIAVTGASRGIGAAIARDLAGRGFIVGCLSRKGHGIEDGEGSGDIAERLIPFACDVTEEASVAAALADLVCRTGRLDGLVNNAGIHDQGPSHAYASEDFASVLAVNSTAVFAACREAHPHLVASGGGVIVNIGSHYDKLGVKQHAAYCASKAAVGAITRCLAVEWAQDGIRVVDVAPGFTLTDLNRPHMDDERFAKFITRAIPGGRPGEPGEIARFVAAIISEDIPFLTGETFYIDGGQAISN